MNLNVFLNCTHARTNFKSTNTHKRQQYTLLLVKVIIFLHHGCFKLLRTYAISNCISNLDFLRTLELSMRGKMNTLYNRVEGPES